MLLVSIKFQFPCKNTLEILIQETDKELQTNGLAAMQHRPQAIYLIGFLKCQGSFSLLILFFLDAS